MKILLFFLTLVLFSCSVGNIKKKAIDFNCLDLISCIAELDKLEDSDSWMSRDDILLAKRISMFGRAALPDLIGLLDSDNKKAVKIVAYSITNIEVIDDKYLFNIVDGIEKGVPFISRALGGIALDKAAELAVQYYLESPAYSEGLAVKRQGERALPYLLGAAKSRPDRGFELSRVLGQMDDSTKKLAANAILQELFSHDVTIEERKGLLSLFREMGEAGRFVEDRLYSLRDDEVDLENQINLALIGIKSKYSGRIFADSLVVDPNVLVLRDLAEIGPAAQDAGPVLIKLLSHSEREIRLGAVRALGYIEYKKSERFLIPLMTLNDDIPLNWAAAVALGMLGKRSSVSSLEAVSMSHWYPAVRHAASMAIDRINNKGRYTDKFPERRVVFRILCHFFKLNLKEMIYERQNHIRYRSYPRSNP
ncbi:MAG: HEAT repeat domain-containing protein [Cellvibrionaceae bacterium]